MTGGLTERQRDCLNYLKAYIAEYGGMAPTMGEIAANLGLSSKSGVMRLLDSLEERGFIRRLRFRSRAIEISGTSGLDIDHRVLDMARRAATARGQSLTAYVEDCIIARTEIDLGGCGQWSGRKSESRV